MQSMQHVTGTLIQSPEQLEEGVMYQLQYLSLYMVGTFAGMSPGLYVRFHTMSVHPPDEEAFCWPGGAIPWNSISWLRTIPEVE